MTRTLFLSLLLVGVLAPPASPAPVPGELSRDAKDLLDAAYRMVKGTKFNESQERILKKAAAGVKTEELSKIVDLIYAYGDHPSRLAVLAVLEGELYPRLYGKEPIEFIEGFGSKLRSPDPAQQEGLLAAALALEDLRLALALARKAAAAESPVLRARAAIAFGDLIGFGHEHAAAGEALEKLLDDPLPAVRAVACRRGFEIRLDAVVPWAIAHLGDKESVAFTLRGENVTLTPGEEALNGLLELTRLEEDTTYPEYRRASEARRKELAALYEAWWKDKGGTFPPPGFREAAFKAVPSQSLTRILGKDETTVSFQFWAGADRTQIRFGVDEFTWSAASLHDFAVSYHARYMAQGQRMDDGEDFVRRHPAGVPRILARKSIGCYVLVFQYLLGDRVRVFLRFYDPA